ncbi:family 43 glycosylhydrolase [Fodinicola acaciae]|uniref:family 43 glycosylhydrolase n=1 Tax=Fodinicola acaciae TaxID=2681555 RepID=UPI0013D855BD|nr:RICIN domain-containing protein [Fodinicola acaciae]
MRLAVALSVLLSLLVTPAYADAAPAPLIARDFPDADVLVDGGNYYAYSTNSSYGGRLVNVPIATAASAAGPWTASGADVLPTLPGWVTTDPSNGTKNVWAPDVSRRDDGVFLMYYTARHSSGLQCIGAATASTPTGPFTPVGTQPLVCNSPDHGDIDPSSLVIDGHRYLVYKDNANSAGQPASVWINETAANGINWVGDRFQLLTADSAGDEHTVLDAPTIVRHDSQYVLFYSADAWNASYHVKYAVSSTLTGRYTKQGTVLDSATWPGVVGNPGGQDVVGDRMFFHASKSNGRNLYAAPLSWPHGVPTVATATIPAGDYVLTAQHSGQSLDVFNGSTVDGERVIQWPYHGKTNQEWHFAPQADGSYAITASHSGLALTATDSQVVQSADRGLSSQRWYLDEDLAGGCRIVSVATGKLLDVYDASMDNGANVITWPNNGGANQHWRLEKVASIMPLGDSITYGNGDANDATSYRTGLWNRFMAAPGVKPDFVGSVLWGNIPDSDNEGHPGWRIDQIADGIANSGWLASQPKYVLLHIGTNDVNQDYQLPTAPDRLRDLINLIKSKDPGVTILVASIIPARDATLNARVNAYNAAIPAIVQQAGANVRFVDMNARITIDDLSPDGIHPSDAGYLKMGDVWYDALSPVVR